MDIQTLSQNTHKQVFISLDFPKSLNCFCDCNLKETELILVKNIRVIISSIKLQSFYTLTNTGTFLNLLTFT